MASGALIKKSEFLSKAVSPNTPISVLSCSKVMLESTTFPLRFKTPRFLRAMSWVASTSVQFTLSIIRVHFESSVFFVLYQDIIQEKSFESFGQPLILMILMFLIFSNSNPLDVKLGNCSKVIAFIVDGSSSLETGAPFAKDNDATPEPTAFNSSK